MLNIPPRQLRPIRVGFLSPSLTQGGAEQWLVSLAGALVSSRPTGLVVLSPAADDSLLRKARGLMSVRLGDNTMERAIALARKVLAEADVVLTWGCAEADRYVESLDVPLVEVIHCADAESEHNRRFAAEACSRANYITAVNLACLAVVPERYRPHVRILPNGADPARIAPRFGRDALRRSLRISDGDRIVLYVGRIAKEKNVALLVEAIAALPNHYKAIIVGPNHGELTAIKDDAARYANMRVGFASPQDHLGDWLAAADVLASPSRSEAHSLAINEAWLAGVPVVSTAHESMRHFHRLHGELGWLVDEQAGGDGWAEAIRTAADAGRASERVRRAYTIAWQHYTTASMAARWESYLATEVLPDWYGHALWPALHLACRGAKPQAKEIAPVASRGYHVSPPRSLRIGFFPECDHAGHPNLTSAAILSASRELRASCIELCLEQRRGVDIIWADRRRIAAENLAGSPLLIDEVTDVCQVLDDARGLFADCAALGIVKSHVYRPRSIYDAASPREFYRPTAQLPPDTARLFVSIGYGALERLAPLRTEPLDLCAQREIDVFFAGTVDYPDDAVTAHRRACVAAVERIGGCRIVCHSERPHSTAEFWQHLRRARICVSPWGWGADCHRDAEAILAGCVVVKPHCDFVDTWPDIYRANLHYTPCRLDFADLALVVERILDRWDEYRQSREAGRAYLIECGRPDRIARHISAMVRSALDGAGMEGGRESSRASDLECDVLAADFAATD